MRCGQLALNAITECDAAIAERDRLIELNDRLRRLLRRPPMRCRRGKDASIAAHCPPICRAFTRRLHRSTRTALSGGSDTAKIIRYGLRHWDGLIRFLDDGRIELDTNIVERSMRPQALTRKNALFAGHDDGAENWAILASLIETAKLSGVDPHAWLADILTRLVNLWPANRLDELLPWTWAAARRQQQRAA
jgi:hypothetical protein